MSTEELRLDLGSGPRPLPGFKGVDVIEGITDYTFDFNDGRPWPFADDSVSELRAAHLIEHIDSRSAMCWEPVNHPAGAPTLERGGRLWQGTTRTKDLLFHFFDEAYRVAKPGARFEVRCPSYSHDLAHGDPTHRRSISHELVHYLNRAGREKLEVGFYAVNCNWVGRVGLGVSPPEGLLPASAAHVEWQSVLMDRASRELNVALELIFDLTAEKP
jgi:hypothetical protein